MPPRYTPEPWEAWALVFAGEDASVARIQLRRAGDLTGPVIAELLIVNSHEEEAEANARLLARAPELASELRRFVDDCACQHDAVPHPEGCGKCTTARGLLTSIDGAPT